MSHWKRIMNVTNIPSKHRLKEVRVLKIAEMTMAPMIAQQQESIAILILLSFAFPFMLEITLVWAAHIAINSSLGCGLKFPTSFKHPFELEVTQSHSYNPVLKQLNY